MTTILFNKTDVKDRRVHLRNHSTPAEILLWTRLKGSQLKGRKFRRQTSIGNYVVDFYCPREKLIIELDGNQHKLDTNYKNDNLRDSFLNEKGMSVLRIENKLIFKDIDFVLQLIIRQFKD